MKSQDILFAIALLILLTLRRPQLFIGTGIICLVLSIPLFTFHIFFTAERLTMYAGGFIFCGIIFLIKRQLVK
jgi:hypothetical protein